MITETLLSIQELHKSCISLTTVVVYTNQDRLCGRWAVYSCQYLLSWWAGILSSEATQSDDVKQITKEIIQFSF